MSSDPVLTTIIVTLAVVGVVGCIAAQIWLKRREAAGIEPTALDQLLKLAAIPLLILISILGVIALRGGGKGPDRREGDDDLAPDEEPTDTRETEAERVARVIKDEAERVEEHITETATDDEVAARGAALFDPGVSDDEPKE
jgi:hypothetical protein